MKTVHTPAYRTLIELLVKARKSTGLTQNDLALKLGKPQSYVAKFEGHERRLDLLEVLLIARELHLDPHALVSAVEEKLR